MAELDGQVLQDEHEQPRAAATQAPASKALSPRKAAILDHADRVADERAGWRDKAAFFHGEDECYLRFLIPPGSRVHARLPVDLCRILVA